MRPMATPSTAHFYNAAKFRLGRVAKDWGELEAILREASSRPNYAGPSIETIKQLGADIAKVRTAVRDWPVNMTLREFGARRQDAADGVEEPAIRAVMRR
jgi:hypothetical protein